MKFVFIDSKLENEISKSLKSLSNFSNKTSKLMKLQYEQNPYPRWRFTARPVQDQNFKLFAESLTKTELNKNYFKHPEILIAGSGTGRQIVELSAFRNSQICAVDISKDSLVYSIRKTKELKISNIKHYHIDILDLELLKKKFDLIVCTGCLHHMENPEEGLDSLVRVLKPGGIITVKMQDQKLNGQENILKETNLAYLLKKYEIIS